MAKPKHNTETAAPVEGVTEHPVGEVHEASMLSSADTWIGAAFIIFAAIAYKFVLPTVTKGLDGRAGKIRDQLEQASRLRTEAEALLADYRQQQQAMLKEAETILTTAKKDAEAMRTRAAEDLKIAIDRRTQQAQEKIARAEIEAVSEIRNRIINLAAESARNILARESSGNDEQAIARALTAIEKQIH